eukprot:6403072-Prymnesium_polylepis.1
MRPPSRSSRSASCPSAASRPGTHEHNRQHNRSRVGPQSSRPCCVLAIRARHCTPQRQANRLRMALAASATVRSGWHAAAPPA